jgi:hypothetical protein
MIWPMRVLLSVGRRSRISHYSSPTRCCGFAVKMHDACSAALQRLQRSRPIDPWEIYTPESNLGPPSRPCVAGARGVRTKRESGGEQTIPRRGIFAPSHSLGNNSLISLISSYHCCVAPCPVCSHSQDCEQQAPDEVWYVQRM